MEEVVLRLCFGRDTDFFFPGRDRTGEKRDGGGNAGLGFVASICVEMVKSG